MLMITTLKQFLIYSMTNSTRLKKLAKIKWKQQIPLHFYCYQIYLQLQYSIDSNYYRSSHPRIYQQMMLSTPSNTKRQIFHSQIRNKQIQTIISKMRIRIAKQDRIYFVNNMVQQILEKLQISAKQLMLLMKWAHEECQQAIAAVGNFVIDGIVCMEMFKECQSKCRDFGRWGWLGKSQVFLWMLHIIYERNYFGQPQLMYLIQSICNFINLHKSKANLSSVNQTSYLYQHGILLLRKICKNHKPAIQLLLEPQNKQHSENLFKSLIDICQAGLTGKIVQSVMSIFANFCLVSGKILSINRLNKLVTISRNRKQSKIRSLCYQMLTNIIIQKYQVQEYQILCMVASLVNTLQNQSKSVQLQLSYLFLNMLQKCQISYIQQLIYKQNFLNSLICTINTTPHPETTHNILKILYKLKQNRHQLIQNLKINQLQKFWFLESQKLQNLLMKLEFRLELEQDRS